MHMKKHPIHAIFCILFLILVLCITASFAPTSNKISPAKTDSFSLSDGKKIFMRHCTGCHGQKGQGDFGPNLCDKYWIHGGHYYNIVHTIKHGVPKKGMTSFKHTLTHAEVRDVAHYVMLTLAGSNPGNAKKPEGKQHTGCLSPHLFGKTDN